ncbi:phosphonate C-P lyase system protein PhnH [Halomicroarcula sp. S1AR25-4]|uniref:phosphonate C-P lyase system protein PhnH n=1 Tax=Haloarcula sp. S1AR25-4 TaxID=2950538 RepID=UPI0028740009|nr:phosphonate C-P lyase system protein PhnH [Halomicroarcula sp. S1AR25-4]MDS0278060.1 phosphonate C-P lyase system protein PhnH [Halomicroarcula sp. S1AR25-4]
MRALGIDPVHETRETFRALLDAMSRPGTVESVPEPADYAVVATLVDHEVTVATDDETLREALSSQGRLDAAPPEEADVVHARESHAFDVRECTRGTLVEPSGGATVVYEAECASGRSEDLTPVTLFGPGVDGTATLSVGVPPSELDALATAQSEYPRGVDAVFAAGDRVAAIPRSVTLTVSDETTADETAAEEVA